jgi:hypothetical protein
MDRIDRWKLADELNVFQIALLITGYDPSDFDDNKYDRWPEHIKRDAAAYLTAIKNAATKQKIEFTEVKYGGYNGEEETDWYRSLINIDSLCDWLRNRNFIDGYFFSIQGDSAPLSNKTGAFYAPKLAAAVRAWNEVTSSPEALNGKTPKKALEIWLRKHANEYGLTNKDGNPNELGIEEICKVANWKPSGGASPTPTLAAKPTQGLRSEGGRVQLNPPTGLLAHLPDDDIPF